MFLYRRCFLFLKEQVQWSKYRWMSYDVIEGSDVNETMPAAFIGARPNCSGDCSIPSVVCTVSQGGENFLVFLARFDFYSLP